MEYQEGADTVTATEQTPTETPELQTPAAAPAQDVGVAGVEQTQPVDTNAAPQARQEPAGQPDGHRSRVDRRNAELSRRNRELEMRLARLEGRVESVQAPAPTKTQDDDPEPDPKNFPGGEFGNAYLRAAAAWDYRQEAKKERERAMQSASERERQAVFAEGAARFQATRNALEDAESESGARFLTWLDHNGHQGFIDDLTDTDNAADLIHRLSLPGNKATLDKLWGMTPRQRVREISRLDDWLTAQKRGAKKSGAPSGAAPSANSSQPQPQSKVVPQPAPQVPTGKGSAKPNGSASGRALDDLYS